MFTRRARLIGRQEAEELVAGAPATADRAGLVRLLALAASPPHADELVGREAALAAFLRAQRDLAIQRSRRPTVLRTLSRAILVKALTGLTLFLVGGVALAASTGSLPAEVQHDAHNLLSPLGVKVPDATVEPGRDLPSHRPTRSPSPTLSPSPSPSPTPDAVLLCHAWTAAKKAKQSPDPAVQAALVILAGGSDKISAFCTKQLAPSPSPSRSPSHSPSPSGSHSPKRQPAPSPSPTPSPTRPSPSPSRH